MIDAAGAPYVVPIEVKSGKSSKRHAALDALIGVKNYKLEGAIVLRPDAPAARRLQGDRRAASRKTVRHG